MPPAATRNRLMNACGVLGSLMLLAYFTIPFCVPQLGRVLYASHPTEAAIVGVGRRYHELIYAGTWLQTTGALLMVVFLLSLADATRGVGRACGTNRVATNVVQVGATSLLALVLTEALCGVAWAGAAVNGQVGSARVIFDLMAPFSRVYPLIAVPAISLGLGILLTRSAVLPRAFAPLSLALGMAFLASGLVGLMVPAAAAATGGLAGLQALWILAAALAFRGARRDATMELDVRLEVPEVA